MKPPVYRFLLSVSCENAYDRVLIEGVSDFVHAHSECVFSLVPPTQLERELVRERPDGVICRLVDQKTGKTVRRLGIPVVDLISSQPPDFATAVTPDNALIGRMAAEHFLDRRFTRFAFFGYRGIDYSERRRDGFLARLAEAGFRARVFEAATGRWRYDGFARLPGYPNATAPDAAQLVRQIASLEKPVAVFCCHDPRAVAVLAACRRSDVAVPGEVALLGVDNDPICCCFSSPRISSVDPSARRMGQMAAERLLELAATGTRSPLGRALTIPPEGIVMRESSEAYPIKPDWLSDALVYIRRNAMRGISAGDVFSTLGLSHTLVQSTFRKTLGTSVQKAIVDIRMDEARRLLKTSRLPVSEVAAASGFASLHYFSQSFTAAHGVSPQAWRERELAADANRRNT